MNFKSTLMFFLEGFVSICGISPIKNTNQTLEIYNTEPIGISLVVTGTNYVVIGTDL